jgi:hypothetical protein
MKRKVLCFNLCRVILLEPIDSITPGALLVGRLMPTLLNIEIILGVYLESAPSTARGCCVATLREIFRDKATLLRDTFEVSLACGKLLRFIPCV